ncbi:acyl--CoA ligase [Kitasatospora sp. MMS16-BH015]|uniref:class I adenylate-forming enzyme family protein n=1 Tax=Kitasatospora sp. MMS16-BH015 TaxID=2018025 RepID=UPI000CA35DB0|nr:class I adenylate-forming enzyme family protein [Kitasatospora sp. MMS16-BH015]AUG77894.1 acyl--CoA ligase [Kitasatospora sp. MMS16-BH015]
MTPDAEAVHRYRGIGDERDLGRYPTMPAALAEQARLRPDAPYLTAVSADGEESTLRYGELDAASAACAHWLRTELGVRPGDVVALVPLNDLWSVVALFGVLRAGASCQMLGPADPADRMRSQARSQGAVLVLRSPAVDCPLGEAVAVPDFTRAPAAPAPGGPVTALDPASAAVLFATSGSTAASKIVVQSHRNAATNAEAFCRHHRLRPGDRVLGFLPIHHANGVHTTLFAPLNAGAHVVLAARFDPFGYPELLRRYRPRIASAVPSVLEALLETWRDPQLPPGFDYFLTAAAPLGVSTARRVASTLGARVVQGYGLTETTNFSTTLPTDLGAGEYRRVMLETDVPPVGAAVFGCEIAVFAEDGTPCPPGGTGEIRMRGHSVMAGYGGNPEATAAAFQGGWFRSGDLGHLVERGGADPLLVITGRAKNIAKVRGEAVSLEEMERALCALDFVRDAACVPVPHRFDGERITAAVVTAAERDAEIAAHLRTLFPAAALPHRIVRVPVVPRTATGKILRPELRGTLGL